MAKYEHGDIVLVHFPFEKNDGEKVRPALLWDIIGEDYYCLMITSSEKNKDRLGVWIDCKSPENKTMKLNKDSFINLTRRFVKLTRNDIIKLIGICPEVVLNKVTDECNKSDIEMP